MAINDSGTDLHALKTSLRKKHLQIRNTMDKSLRTELSMRICSQIISSDDFVSAENVLLYCNYGSEVETSFLFSASEKLKKNVFFPKVNGDDMIFYKITPQTPLAEGYKGIMEPLGETARWNGEAHSLIIVPGTVFHPNGYRIGYGKGFYDRFLSKYPQLLSVGICFSNQMDDALIAEPFDIPLHYIVTDKERYEKNGAN